MGDVLPPPPSTADRPLELHHVGQRFGLGSGSDFFGIWDTHTPGTPVERFPRTGEGWRDAWTAFSRLEPTVASTAVAPAWGSQSWQDPSQMAPVSQSSNGPAVASLVLGILGVVLWIPFVGLSLGIMAMVFAYLGFKRADQTGAGRGFAVAGLVLGIVAGVGGVLVLALFNDIADRIDQIRDLDNL